MADIIPTPGNENAAEQTGMPAKVGSADVDDAAMSGVDPSPPPETPAEPEEESDEAWMRRFIEENIHLASPPVVRPPAPPPQPWDGPRSQWKVPDHLSMPHPKGGYMAMALMSRTMDDFDEVTGGKRAATYEEVDKDLGHALIAEGLVPFTYTADEAIRWWKAGGYRVLGSASVGPEAVDPGDIDATRFPEKPEQVGSLSPNASFMIDPDGSATSQMDRAVLLPKKQKTYDAAAPVEDGGAAPGERGHPLTPISFGQDMELNPFADLGEKMVHGLSERRDRMIEELENLPSKAANALANRMRGANIRDLTPGEYKSVWDAFGGMIDLSDVKIVIGPGKNPLAQSAFTDERRPAITVGNTVYINRAKMRGVYRHYAPDLSKYPSHIGLLIHEFYHVLQYQRKGFAKFLFHYGVDQAEYGPSSKGFDTEAVYEYSQRALPFDQETIEGQAQIAGDYAKVRAGKAPAGLLEKRLRGTGIYGF